MNPNKKMMILSGLLSVFLVFGFVAQVYAAEAVTVKGEVIDTYCYALMGAKGEGHRQCAIDCVKAGIPAGLEEGTGKVYVLLPSKDKTGLPKELWIRWDEWPAHGKVYTSVGASS
jgi:hypothetical protein